MYNLYNDDEETEEKTPEAKNPFEAKMLETRTIFIFGEITQELAEKVCMQLILLQALNDNPITIYINSQGGHVEAGDTIHDMIKFIRPEVYIIGTGWVASAGVSIYLGANKENRFALPNTRFMIHQAVGGVRGKTTDIEIETRESLRMAERLNKMISDGTGQPIEKVKQDTDRNYWMSNEEAIAYGIAHKIINTIDELPTK